MPQNCEPLPRLNLVVYTPQSYVTSSAIWDHTVLPDTKHFKTLKSDLARTCETRLHTVQLDRPYDLYVDTSWYAIAGILIQTSESGIEYFIAFFSSKLTPTQMAWATVEREAYAVLKTVMRYKRWFYGSKITIHSDHNPLTYLTESAPKSSKLMRWSLALAEFN